MAELLSHKQKRIEELKNDREYRDRKILKAKYSYEHKKKVNK